MWDLKISANKLIYKSKIYLKMQKINLWLPGHRAGGGINFEDWDCHKHTTIHKIDNIFLLYSIANFIQYSVMVDRGKEFIKECICVCITDSLAVHLKLTQHCKKIYSNIKL